MTKRRFYLVAGSKGGVGKSLSAMALIDFLLQLGTNVFLFESDTSNPDVCKPYATSLRHELVDLDDRDGWIEMANRAHELPDHTCVVNTGSRNNVAVQKYASVLAGALQELNVELVTLWMINAQRDSIELLHQYRASLPTARIHVLRNSQFAKRFDLYDQSEIRKAIELAGGRTHTFPQLGTRVTDELYNARQTLESVETSANMPLGTRIEARRWRSEVSSIFAAVVEADAKTARAS